jgi:membrane peptidoglycan carboxypeptidase
MVGLMDSPALNPLDSKAAALDLQKTVLTTLEQRGSIPADQLRHARQETLTFKTEPALQANPYSAFIQHLKEQLEPYLGTNRLERGGLVIRSTLDVNLQSQLRCAALTQLFRIESTALGGVASEPQNCPAALLLPTQSYSEQRSGLAIRGIVVDSSSGQVLAYLPPSTQFGDTLTDDRVQPGSLLAPIIALSGFAHGESPSSLMWDIPSSLPADLAGTGNTQAAFHGPVRLRMAVANDYLVPLASLAEQIGPSTVWQMGASLGLNSLANSTPSVRGLFAGEPVPLLELSQVYATLASSGVRSGAVNPLTKQIDLSMVLQVNSVSQRQLLNLETPQKLSIVSDSLAYLINHVLSDDAARRPELGYPNLLEISRPAAAKLGETQSKDQVWTAGYTPDRVVLIGIQSTPESGNSAPPQPLMAAGVWNAIIQTASSGYPATGWSQPSGVTTQMVCSPSGLLPTEACPNVVNEVFLAGNEPVQADNLYRRVMINRETGLLATVFTPPALVEARVTMDVPVEARDWALAAGLPLTPTGYDAIRVPVPDPRVQITSPALFATVQGIVEIRGTATDTAFKSYSVQVGEGINPSNWVQVGEVHTTPVTDGVLATWNTGSLDGLYAIRLTVVDQANQIKTAVIQVTVDGVPPQAVILSPQPEAQISPVMGVITFSARVSDNTAISRVEWWLDGKKIQETGVSPYSCVWQAVSGKHELFLKAWDTAGNAATSAKVTFTVTQ